MQTLEKITINGVDCYGKFRNGVTVEVITNNDSWLIDSYGHNSWEALVKTLQTKYKVVELLADA